MTWLELKNNIRDLGFDDEYPETIITSANRAINIIHKTIVERYEEYFKDILSEEEWELPEITPIKETTKDTFVIEIPDKLIDLVPLLAAHYAWLDDDIQKATQYWNEYDDLKNQLIEDMDKPRHYEFYGGLRW